MRTMSGADGRFIIDIVPEPFGSRRGPDVIQKYSGISRFLVKTINHARSDAAKGGDALHSILRFRDVKAFGNAIVYL